MTPLEMIAEWRKGCSCGGPVFDRIKQVPEGTHSPAECVECTEALIEALEKVLREPNDGMVDAGVAEFDFGKGPPDIWKAMAGVSTIKLRGDYHDLTKGGDE